MQISGTLACQPVSLGNGEPSPYTIKRTDAAFEELFSASSKTPEEELLAITKGGVEGMLKWKIDELKKQAAEKSLAARGLTKDDVQAMPAKQRVAVEQAIIREVAEAVKEVMKDLAKTGNDLLYGENSAPQDLTQGLDISA